MAKTAIRSVMDNYQARSHDNITVDLIIITGKGLRSVEAPILASAVAGVLQNEYHVVARQDEFNEGRLIVDVESLKNFVARGNW